MILIGNNVVNIGVLLIVIMVVINIFGSSGVGIVIGIMIILIFIFGEVILKFIVK